MSSSRSSGGVQPGGQRPGGQPDHRLGPTRVRDLLVVVVIAAAAAYLFIRINYGALPRLPRFAGASAALLGIGEAVVGWGLRRRLRDQARADRERLPAVVRIEQHVPEPIAPLVAARILAVAKASALAAAAFGGLWIGFGAYVLPTAARAEAAAADSSTSLIGLGGAVLLLAGALWLEYCCRAPADRDD